MNILVLDTIHGGAEIACHLTYRGYHVDTVDIYRGKNGITENDALNRDYDLVIAPVHMDPDHPLLKYLPEKTISHHEAVAMICGSNIPDPTIEITGMQGKTTTAYALAHILKGEGVLHTSGGTWEIPEKKFIWKKSITPASTIDAAAYAFEKKRWLIAEESIGVSGAGDIGVLTSGLDYMIASGKKSALAEKKRLLEKCRTIVAAPGINWERENVIHAERFAGCTGEMCTYSKNGITGTFSNPLLTLKGYRSPLITAAAVACVLGRDPKDLATFKALKGRMSTEEINGTLIVDNSNSGTNMETTIDAAEFARSQSGNDELTLVIGIESKNICEGFSRQKIEETIRTIQPSGLIIVSENPDSEPINAAPDIKVNYSDSLKNGRRVAIETTDTGSIVLAIKTWR